MASGKALRLAEQLEKKKKQQSTAQTTTTNTAKKQTTSAATTTGGAKSTVSTAHGKALRLTEQLEAHRRENVGVSATVDELRRAYYGTPGQSTANAGMNALRSAAYALAKNSDPNNLTALVARKTALTRERARLDDMVGQYDQSDTELWDDWHERSNAINEALAKLNSQISTAEGNARLGQYDKLRSNSDFAEYAAKGEALENPDNQWQAVWTKNRVQNPVTYARAQADKAENWMDRAVSAAFNYGQSDSPGDIQKLASYMSDDEVSMYNYLLAKDRENGTGESSKYLSALMSNLQARQSERYVQGAQEWSTQSGTNAMLSSVNSVLRSPANGLAYVEAVADKARERNVNQNSAVAAQASANIGVRGSVAGKIQNDVTGATGNQFLGDAASFLYQTGMSIADSAYNVAITGGNAGMSAVLMSGSAATSAMNDALEQGANERQALAIGGAAGIFESLFEYVSLDKLVKMSSPAARGSAVLNVLKQMGIEASEEAATEIANIAVDYALMGDASQYRKMSPAQIAWQVTMAAFGGGLSGGVMGGGAQLVSGMRARTIGSDIRQQGLAESVMQDAANSGDGQLASLAQRMEQGKAKQSSRNLGRLYAGMAENGTGMPSTEAALREAAYQMAAQQEEQTADMPAEQQDTVQPPETRRPAQTADTQAQQQEKPAQNASNAAESGAEQQTGNPSGRSAESPSAARSARRDSAVSLVDDERITAAGIDAVEDGTVYVRTEDGGVLALGDVEFSNPDVAAVYQDAAQYDTDAAQKYVSAYDGTATPEQYRQGFAAVYRAARSGLSYEQALGSLPAQAYLTPDQRITAYAAGQKTASAVTRQAEMTPDFVGQTQKTTSNAAVQNAKKTYRTGLNREYVKAALNDTARENLRKHREQLHAVDVMAKKYGRKVVLVDTLEGKTISGTKITEAVNGAYDGKTGTIYIAADAQDGAFAYVAMHELVHSVRSASESDYNALQTTVFDALTKDGQNVDDLVKYQIDTFGYSEDVAREEVVANSAATVLTDEEFVRNLYNNEHSLFEQIRKFFKELADTFKQLTQSASWSQDAALTPENVRAIAEVFDRVAADTAATGYTTGKQMLSRKEFSDITPATREESLQLDLLDERNLARYFKEVNSALDGSMPVGKLVLVGKPPKVLVEYMKSTNPIQIPQKIIKKAALSKNESADGKHALGRAVIEQLPVQLTYPMAITGNTSDHQQMNDNSIVVWTDWKTEAGASVIVPIRIDVTGNVGVYNNINSVFDAYDNSYVADLLRGGNILYTRNGKNIQELLSQRREVPQVNRSDVSSRNSVAEASDVVKFSAKDPVEKKGTLLAIHNLTEEKLKKFLALGGAPMPSIAVTRSDVEHSNFGDISLIFDKSTIDPKVNRKNTVYSADAWTPTFPQIEYETNTKVGNAVYSRLTALSRKMDEFYREDLKRVLYGVDEGLNRYGGEAGFVEHVMDNLGLQAAYLEDNGEHIDRITKQVERDKGYSEDRAERYQKVVEVLGTTDADEIGKMPLSEIRDRHSAELEKAVPGITKSALRLSGVLKQTMNYLRNAQNGTQYDTVTDYNAMRSEVEKRIDKPAFEKWVKELYSGIESGSGVYNGKDLYTPSGNRRSFAATHYPATLENIAKAMAAQNGGDTKNVSGFNGIKTLRAGMAQRFKSIADMHAFEGRLQNRTQEQADALNNALSDRMFDLMERIDATRDKRYSSMDNSLMAMDNVGEIMMEIADGGKYSAQHIRDVFNGYGLNIDEKLSDEVRTLLFDVQQMPVNLFEAKPERAVYTNEVRMAVMPEGEYPELQQQFRNMGIPVETYDPEVQGDRVRVMNSDVTEPLRFSVKDVTPEDTQRLEKENARLKVALENARAQVRLTGGNQVSAQAVEKLARKIVRDTHSRYDAAALAGDLGQIYTYAATAENSEEALREIDDVGIGLAKKVLRQSEHMDTTVSDQLTGLKDYLRNTGLSLNEDQKAEAAAMYGSYNDFRRQVFGTIKLTRDGVPLDVAWGELHDAYPWLFDADGTDMLESLVHAAELTRPQLVNPYGYNLDEAAADLWLTMQQEYANLPVNRTYADRQKARIDALRTEQAENLRRMRQEAKDRYEQRLKAVKAENRAKRAELSEQYKKAVEDVKTAERMAEGKLRAKERQRAQEQLQAAKQRAKELARQHQLLANEKLAQQQARSDTRISALESQVRELKQLVKDERVAGKANAANESKRREYRNEVIESATSLSDWIMSPLRSKRHIPKNLLYEIADAVASIDLGDGKHMSAEVKQWRERVVRMRAAAALVNEPIYSEQYGDVQKKLEELAENHKPYQIFTGNKDSKAAENRRKREERIQQDARLVSQFVPEVKGSLNIDQMGIDELRGLARTLRTIERAVIHTSEQRDRTDAEKYRARIVANAKTLAGWLEKPTDDKHVPESLRRAVSGVLETIELGNGARKTKKAEAWRERLMDLAVEMDRIDNAPDEGTYLDVDPDLTQRIRDFVSGTRNLQYIDLMSAEQLRDLDYILQVTKRTVTYANRLRANAQYQQISALGEASIKEMDGKKAKPRMNAAVGKLDQFFNIQQLDSFAFFDELGGAATSVLQELRDGFDVKVRRVQRAVEYVQPFLEDVDVRKLSGKGAQIRKFTVENGTLRMTTAQIMELYELLKREQARGHIFGSGIRVADISRGKLRPEVVQLDPVRITAEEAERITGTLTDEQKQLADQLAWFLGNECAAWGNQTSQRMYGYKKFTEKNYYPIKTDSNYTQTSDKNDKGQNGSLAALKNLGMTKAVVKGANNPLIVGDIFDTFTQHVDDMASYNGMMIPLSDAMKWFNYRARTDDMKVRSVKRSMERRAGRHAQGYFTTLIKNLNGINDRGERIDVMDVLTSNAKAAAIGANLRVVLQQPTAYARAAAVISPKYLIKAWAHLPDVRGAKQNSAIAQWKSWGFYDISIGKSMRGLLFDDGSVLDNVKEWSMAPAGLADEVTWGTLFNACRLEAQEQHPGASQQEIDAAAGRRLSEIVDRTQVVDSPFHKSQIMRSKDGLTRMYTAFMAEPTKSYNLLRTALSRAIERKDKESMLGFVRTSVVFLATSAFTSAFAAVADMLRDDDKTKTLIEKYLAALKANMVDNANPLALIPVVKDILSLLEGYDVSRLDLQAADKLINTGRIWIKQLSAETGEKPYTNWYMAYQTAQALSSVTGIPAGNLMRTVSSVANLFGADLRSKSSSAAASQKYEELYNAILKEDQGYIDRLNTYLQQDKEKSPKDIDSGVAKVLMERDERIAEAYALRQAGDVKGLEALRKEIAEVFGEEIVDRAINLYANTQESDEEKDMNEELSAPLYDYDDMAMVARLAFESGETEDLAAVVEEIKRDSSAKDPEETVRNKAVALFKPEYLERLDAGDTAGTARMKQVLMKVYGLESDTIDAWRTSQRRDELYALIDAGSAKEANSMIVQLRSLGRDNDSVRDSVRAHYKPLVVEAWNSGDLTTYKALVNTLKNLNLYDAKGKLYFTDERILSWLED